MSEPTTDPKRMALPNAAYKLRVIGCEGGKTKKTNMKMFTLECEFVENAPVNGVDINGLTSSFWHTFTPDGLFFVNQCRTGLGLSAIKAEDFERIQPGEYLGKAGYAICNSEEVIEMNESTKPPTPIINPHTGKPVTTVSRRIKKWLAPE